MCDPSDNSCPLHTLPEQSSTDFGQALALLRVVPGDQVPASHLLEVQRDLQGLRGFGL